LGSFLPSPASRRPADDALHAAGIIGHAIRLAGRNKPVVPEQLEAELDGIAATRLRELVDESSAINERPGRCCRGHASGRWGIIVAMTV